MKVLYNVWFINDRYSDVPLNYILKQIISFKAEIGSEFRSLVIINNPKQYMLKSFKLI